MAANRYRFPDPGNGSVTFSDNLVGLQFVEGTPQFTIGNFSNITVIKEKENRDFPINNFSQPITLDNLSINQNIDNFIVTNQFKVFINFDTNQTTNFTLYGSLKERMRVTIQNIVKNFPAALIVDYLSTTLLTGNTATNINYDNIEDETSFDVNVSRLKNPFDIQYSELGNFQIQSDDFSKYRNMTVEYTNYVLYNNNDFYNSYSVIDFVPSTTTTAGTLSFTVKGNPFSGQTSTQNNFHFRLAYNTQQKVFDDMGDMENFLLNRESSPIYTASFQVIKESNEGTAYITNDSVTWELQDIWNLDITTIKYESYINKIYELSDYIDSVKTNLISRFLTTASIQEFDTPDEKIAKVLQVYGRSFDETKKYIDGLAYMTNVTYNKKNNIPDVLVKNLAETLGLKVFSAIEEDDLLSSVFATNKQPIYEGTSSNLTPAELNIELYRRILINIGHLFKRKGTRKAIEFLLKFIGAPEPLIQFNEYVYLADRKLNVADFEKKLSLGREGNLQVPNVGSTGSTTVGGVLGRSDYPIGDDGYPTTADYNNQYYFQRGSGWYQRSMEHQSDLVIDRERSVFTGTQASVQTTFRPFDYGQEYLDRYRVFPALGNAYGLTRQADNKKSWVDSDRERYFDLPYRGTDYFTDTDKLVLNVKNVDLFLTPSQGLVWDVWNYSKVNGCIFGVGPLTGASFPSIGGVDWTTVDINPKKTPFFEFANKFYTVLINVKNRQTITDGKSGGYPTLLNVYLNYLNAGELCGVDSNQYGYDDMIKYVSKIGSYWIKLIEQFIPATTIWNTGTLIDNSIFHRQKFVYQKPISCEEPIITVNCDCPSGYIDVGDDICQLLDITAATSASTVYTVSKAVELATYGRYGMRIYDLSSSPPVPYFRDPLTAGTNPHVVYNGITGATELPIQIDFESTFWGSNDCFTAATACGRLNDVGIWGTGGSAPTCEWIGFTSCFELDSENQYYVGIGADNLCRFSIDGTLIFDLSVYGTAGTSCFTAGTATAVENFQRWHMIPFTLTSGLHIVEMVAFNLGAQASFGAEIYNNTIQELTAATATTMLNIVFTTIDITGQTFSLGENSGYSCPDGYALNTCNTGTPYCVKITESNKVCVTTVRGSNPTIPLGLGCSVVIEPITMSASSTPIINPSNQTATITQAILFFADSSMDSDSDAVIQNGIDDPVVYADLKQGYNSSQVDIQSVKVANIPNDVLNLFRK